MYINPYAAGVLTTIFCELALIFVWAVLKSKK
jgi:hypothetical protein